MKYYLANNGQQSGPFELDELWYNGLTSQSMVWREGMPNWLPATQIPEVAALLCKCACPPQVGGSQQNQQSPYPPQNPSKETSFGDAIKICFNKFADFDGRATRSEFWWFYLFCYIISTFTCGFGSLIVLIPMLSAGARRLHDTGRSGWWQLLQLIPFGVIVNIIWWAEDSHPNTNEYGPRP